MEIGPARLRAGHTVKIENTKCIIVHNWKKCGKMEVVEIIGEKKIAVFGKNGGKMEKFWHKNRQNFVKMQKTQKTPRKLTRPRRGQR